MSKTIIVQGSVQFGKTSLLNLLIGKGSQPLDVNAGLTSTKKIQVISGDDWMRLWEGNATLHCVEMPDFEDTQRD